MKPIAKILAAKLPDRDRLIIISFNQDVVRAWPPLMPEYRTCLLSSLDKFTKQGMQEKYLNDLKSCGSQGIAYKENPAIPKQWLADARGKDGVLATWTVNNRESALRAVGHGVEFLITDRPVDYEPNSNRLSKNYPEIDFKGSILNQSGIAPIGLRPLT